MTVLQSSSPDMDVLPLDRAAVDDSGGVYPSLETARRERQTRLLRMVIWAGLAVLFTAFIIQYCLRYGRFLIYPTYDDVSYLCDGLHKQRILADGGMLALLRSFLVRSHSPYAALASCIGFAVFGPHDWSAYATNGVLIFIYLVMVDYLMRGAPLWQRIGAAIFALTVPAAGWAVYDFRPDHAVGLLTAIGVILFVRNPLLTSSLRHKFAAGAMFGIALLVKPSVFPLTCVLFGVSVTLAMLADIVGGSVPKGTPPLRWVGLIAEAIFASLLPVLVIAGPYFVKWGGEVYHYIVINLYGEQKTLWAIHASRMEHIKWYVIGDGGRTMMGVYVYIMAGVLLLAAVVVLLSRRRADIARMVAMGLAWLAAYLPPTVTPNKSYHFGAVMTYLLIFSTIAALHYLLVTVPARLAASDAEATDVPPGSLDMNGNRTRPARWVRLALPRLAGSLFLLALCAGAIREFRMPGKFDEPNGRLQLTRRIGEDVYRALKDARVSGEVTSMLVPGREGEPIVFCNFTGTFNAATLSYFALRDSLDLQFFAEDYTTDLQTVSKALDRADLVVAAEPDNSEVADFMPNGKILGESVALIRARPDFDLFRTIPTRGPGAFLVFRKRWPFTGWLPTSGWEKSGEHPTPLTWWGKGDRSIATIQPPDGHVIFAYSAKPLVANEEVTVLVAGKEVSRQSMPDTTRFYDVRLPLALEPEPQQVEFRYGNAPGGSQRAVEFRSMQIYPRLDEQPGEPHGGRSSGATTAPATEPSTAAHSASVPAGADEPHDARQIEPVTPATAPATQPAAPAAEPTQPDHAE